MSLFERGRRVWRFFVKQTQKIFQSLCVETGFITQLLFCKNLTGHCWTKMTQKRGIWNRGVVNHWFACKRVKYPL